MPALHEPQLIEQAKAGDHQAFRQLVQSHQGFVYAVAFRFVRDAGEAEDLAQECFIRMWKNLDRYNPDYKLKTWLGKMITNLCLDFLKSARKKRDMNQLEIKEELIVPDPRNPETELHHRELKNMILAIAGRLTPKQKAAFVLRDLEMLEVHEVCEILGETAENLKSNLYHARKYIRENLMKNYKTIPI